MDEYRTLVGFDKCPVEIIDQIVSDLSLGDIKALQTTSKYLRTTTEYLLYKEITWVFHNPSSREAPIHLLLRSLLERPELGLLIHSLNFTEVVCINPIWARGGPRLTKQELRSLAMRGREITRGDSKPEKWFEE